MSILARYRDQFGRSKQRWLLGVVLAASLIALCSGCMSMSDQAESDMRWKESNPNWQRTGPEVDPRAQWGEDLTGWPRNRQFP